MNTSLTADAVDAAIIARSTTQAERIQTLGIPRSVAMLVFSLYHSPIQTKYA